jgi:anti-sigma factor RsiW
VTCDPLDRDLDAYVDRELDEAATAAVREHLDQCAACRARVVERQALGRLVRSVPYYSAPDDLRTRVAAQAAQTTRVMSVWRVVTWAAAAIVVVSVGGGIALIRSTVTRNNAAMASAALVDTVVDGHVRSLMAEHLFDVRSTDQHTVKPWFLGKLDFSPPVVDLASIGFPLVGGRLDYVGGRPAAALVYQRQQHTINVFVAPDTDPTSAPAAAHAVRGFHVHHWTRDRMSFWAVSDLNDAELSEFVGALGGPRANASPTTR